LKILNWTHVAKTTPLATTLNELLDRKQLRDPEHMRLIVSASGMVKR